MTAVKAPYIAEVGGAHTLTHTYTFLKQTLKMEGFSFICTHKDTITNKQAKTRILLHTHSHTPTRMYLQIFSVTLSFYFSHNNEWAWRAALYFDVSLILKCKHITFTPSLSQISTMKPKHTNVQHIVYLFIISKNVKLCKIFFPHVLPNLYVGRIFTLFFSIQYKLCGKEQCGHSA